MCDQLTDDDVNTILYVSAPSNRKRKAVSDITPKYKIKQRKQASDLAKQWGESGIPQFVYTKLITSKSALIEKFGWEVEDLTNKEANCEVNDNAGNIINLVLENEPIQVSLMIRYLRYIHCIIIFLNNYYSKEWKR